jgi:rhodanese-related sulfurtransferase
MDIEVQELKIKLARGDDFVLIDVREPYEHEDFNIGGRLIPLGELPLVMESLSEDQEMEIVVYCRSGNRSGMAKYMMEQAGYKNVRNLLGGILAWQEML